MHMRVLKRIEGASRLDRVRNVNLGQIEAGGSVGYSEEAAEELEAKGRGASPAIYRQRGYMNSHRITLMYDCELN